MTNKTLPHCENRQCLNLTLYNIAFLCYFNSSSHYMSFPCYRPQILAIGNLVFVGVFVFVLVSLFTVTASIQITAFLSVYGCSVCLHTIARIGQVLQYNQRCHQHFIFNCFFQLFVNLYCCYTCINKTMAVVWWKLT